MPHACGKGLDGPHWVAFAQEKEGRLELSHDCYGALAISPRRAPTPENEGWLDQMEADFIAGLSDRDPTRLTSIQGLGGLGLSSSRDALHRVIAVMDLIAILQTAPGELTRSGALIALGEKLNDPRAVPSLAAHLSNLTVTLDMMRLSA